MRHMAGPIGVIGLVAENDLAVLKVDEQECRGRVMDAHAGPVDHLDVTIISLCNGVHDPVPDAGLGPTAEPVVAGRGRAVATRQISPRRTSAR